MITDLDAPPALHIRIEYDTRSAFARCLSWDFVKDLFCVSPEPVEAMTRLCNVNDWSFDAKRWLRRAETQHPSLLSLDAIATVKAHASEARVVVLRLLNRQPDVYLRVPRGPHPETASVLQRQAEVSCPCPPMTLATDYHASIIEADLAKIELDAHALFLKVQDWRARRADEEQLEFERRMREADRQAEVQTPT